MKIPLDVDRRIRTGGAGYRANAKKLSVAFGPEGVQVWANEDAATWGEFCAEGPSLRMVLASTPDPPGPPIGGNRIVYAYGDGVRVEFEVLLDRLRRTIVVENAGALGELDRYLACDLHTNLAARAARARALELGDAGGVRFRIETTGVQDAQTVKLDCPCGGEFLCGHAGELGCKGCAGPGSCPRVDPGRRTEVPRRVANEGVRVEGGKLRLDVDRGWLAGARFPVRIHDDVTPAAGSLAGAGGWTTNTGNLVDGNPATHAGDTCANAVDNGFATNYVTIDLGAVYRIDWFKVENDAGLCGNVLDAGAGDWFQYKLQYRDNGAYADFAPSCVISVPDTVSPNNYFKDQKTSNDVSGQNVQVQFVRLLVGGDDISEEVGRYGMNNLTGEIEIWGTAVDGVTASALVNSIPLKSLVHGGLVR